MAESQKKMQAVIQVRQSLNSVLAFLRIIPVTPIQSLPNLVMISEWMAGVCLFVTPNVAEETVDVIPDFREEFECARNEWVWYAGNFEWRNEFPKKNRKLQRRST